MPAQPRLGLSYPSRRGRVRDGPGPLALLFKGHHARRGSRTRTRSRLLLSYSTIARNHTPKRRLACSTLRAARTRRRGDKRCFSVRRRSISVARGLSPGKEERGHHGGGPCLDSEPLRRLRQAPIAAQNQGRQSVSRHEPCGRHHHGSDVTRTACPKYNALKQKSATCLLSRTDKDRSGIASRAQPPSQSLRIDWHRAAPLSMQHNHRTVSHHFYATKVQVYADRRRRGRQT